MASSTTAAAALPPRILTREGTFIDDSWTVLDSAAEARAGGPALLPLVDDLAQPQPPSHGVWLAPTDNAATLEAHLATLPLIAVRFPSFGDGRGYSIAALLRRSGYRGDLRAIGEVLVDQLHMLRRVGFTSFALRADQAEHDARTALNRYSDPYQGAYDALLPAFRRQPRLGATG